MAFGVVADISGSLVAYNERPYSFKDRQTNEQVDGWTRKVWLVHSFDLQPNEVKFKEADRDAFGKLAHAEPGSLVTMTVDVGDKGAVFAGSLTITAPPLPEL